MGTSVGNITAVALGVMRPPFLLLTPACLAPAIATAYIDKGTVDIGLSLLVLLAALLAHIGVNALNEYADFKSGLDNETRRTPFSGGSGSLPAQPQLVWVALAVSLTSLSGMTALGGYFIWLRGWDLLPIGLIGVAIILTYTHWLNRNAALCLFAPGLGFGPLMVLGAYYVLTGGWSATAVVASLPALFLVSNLLLLNQLPDIEADRKHGRRHLPIVLGPHITARVSAALILAVYLSVATSVATGLLPTGALVVLLTLPAAFTVSVGVIRHADSVSALLPTLGLNVLLTLTSPVAMALGLAWL